jgi:LexA-binding, inner membrane-associated putative hydrolase
MPDRKTHTAIGAGTGAAFAFYRAKDQSPCNLVTEVAGGLVGGYLGGLVPDVLEPAVSSWHRDTAHSLAVGGAIISLRNHLSGLESGCRENAEKCKAVRMVDRENTFVTAPDNPLSQFLSEVEEQLWRFLAGFLNGLAAGYVSHLALDAATPRSIPLLTSRS